MQQRVMWAAALVCAGALAVALAACGGGDGGGDSDGGYATGLPVAGQKKGGTLKVLSSSDVDHIDPGQSYYQFTYQVTYATQRPVLSFKPQDAKTQVPDTAASEPEVSPDNKTVTVKIRPGIHYSPPVNREVKAADVKYAIERAFLPSVANGYAGAYFGALTGLKAFQDGDAGDVSGLQTPDDATLVMKFDEPVGATAAKALSLPMSAPVPKEYAQKFDSQKTSTYGDNQVATGPYMIQNDAQGKAIGYQPGRRIILVRNPNWNASTDFRPAYLDRIEFTVGANTNVAGRQILTGENMVNGDTPPASIVARAAKQSRQQLALTPLGNRYISLNTQLEPFDDPNVRKAVVAAMDRTALQLTRGGRLVGDIATHFLAPDVPGFEQAGGMKGTGLDFLAKPEGDIDLAREYLKKAGFPDGRYSGPPILMVSENEPPASKTGEVTLANVEKLGFKVNYRTVTQDAMYTNFCSVPKRKVHICPNVGWLPDFNDGYAYMYPTFNGNAIVPTNNSNWPQLDDPKIDAAMTKAAQISDPDQRAQAWGDIDTMVTEQAPAVPWFWDRQPNIAAKNVQGVIAKWNASWDMSYVSIK